MQQSLFPDESSPSVKRGSSVSRAHLNEAQFEAATCLEGPVLVIAGAGSGKTRTLVYRLAYLVEQGISPESIMLLTFTRKAAQEMLGRASRLLDDSCFRVTGGTFHAVANLLLRRYGHLLGYAPNFTILDQADAEGIVNLIKSSLSLGGDAKRFPSKRVIVTILSKAVNKGVSLEKLVESEYFHLLDFLGDFQRINEHYQRFKREHGLMDYDDLLLNWQQLLVDHPDIREELGRRFSYLMVDEYQDTNPVQAEIVRLMAANHDNVMVVGDDSQSIYSFRGADFRNIMEFPKLFPNARLIRLEENYRSTQAILDLTNAIIDGAEKKYAKRLFTKAVGGEKPVLHGARDESDEARFIAEQLQGLHAQGVPLNEMAVLFRSGFHSYKLELELANRHIEFEKRGGLKLTESAHIKDVLAYMRVVANPDDHLSWNRLLLQIEKVGPKTAQKVLDAVKSSQASPLDSLAEYPASKSLKQGLLGLVDLMRSISAPGISPSHQLDGILDYYRPVFERIYHDDFPRRVRDLEQLKVLLAGYDTLQAFLDDTALDPPQTDNTEGLSASTGGRMVLSTVHSAKGLEWDTVFVMHLIDGKFPSAQAVSHDEREEERRLLYVAATRARKRLFLVYPRMALTPERFFASTVVSPYVDELPAPLLQISPGVMRSTSYRRDAFHDEADDDDSTPSENLPKNCGTPLAAMSIGTLVRHPFFGEGKVQAIAGPRSVDVFFRRHGNKTLHLDYARLEII